MEGSTGSKGLSLGFRTKRSVVRTSLLALGTAFEIVSKSCPELQAELSGWEEGRTVSMGVLPDGPAMAVRKESNHVNYLGQGEHAATLKFLFKNMDSAFLVLTGQLGSDQSFAEHRAIVHGSLDQAMQANRALAMVQKFLMPGLILKKTMKRPPKLRGQDWAVYAKLMLTLTPALLINWSK